MTQPQLPLPPDQARLYYSQIVANSNDSVTVFSTGKGQEASHVEPGTPRLHLVRDAPGLRVRNSGGQDIGTITFAIPAVKYVLSRDDSVVWTLTVRSWLRKRWLLDLGGSGAWTFDTPFFWWQHLQGRIGDTPRLIGRVGTRKSVWLFSVQPSDDSDELLAAIASMHRSWWHS